MRRRKNGVVEKTSSLVVASSFRLVRYCKVIVVVIVENSFHAKLLEVILVAYRGLINDFFLAFLLLFIHFCLGIYPYPLSSRSSTNNSITITSFTLSLLKWRDVTCSPVMDSFVLRAESKSVFLFLFRSLFRLLNCTPYGTE